MRKIIAILAIVLLIVILLLIRAFEETLFYDPLLEYFKGDYKQLPVPDLVFGKLLLHTGFRFLLNSLASLGILWFVFKDKEIMKLSVLLYVLVFAVLITLFSIILKTSSPTSDPMILFYVRRFLIQPLLLLLLLPAFYFHKKKTV
ncbi:MAG TPA: exosortase F system-associated protein [Flavobacteriaceae bacterium]|nr:exosortase F system-associated protein [Flavobacteriaceae bacterium]